jgi:hypothetical protein
VVTWLFPHRCGPGRRFRTEAVGSTPGAGRAVRSSAKGSAVQERSKPVCPQITHQLDDLTGLLILLMRDTCVIAPPLSHSQSVMFDFCLF